MTHLHVALTKFCCKSSVVNGQCAGKIKQQTSAEFWSTHFPEIVWIPILTQLSFLGMGTRFKSQLDNSFRLKTANFLATSKQLSSINKIESEMFTIWDPHREWCVCVHVAKQPTLLCLKMNKWDATTGISLCSAS